MFPTFSNRYQLTTVWLITMWWRIKKYTRLKNSWARFTWDLAIKISKKLSSTSSKSRKMPNTSPSRMRASNLSPKPTQLLISSSLSMTYSLWPFLAGTTNFISITSIRWPIRLSACSSSNLKPWLMKRIFRHLYWSLLLITILASLSKSINFTKTSSLNWSKAPKSAMMSWKLSSGKIRWW